MRIILIGNTARPSSGWGSIVYHHASALHAAGISFILLLPHDSPRIEVPFAKNIRYSLPSLPLTFSTPLSWWKMIRLFRTIDIGEGAPTLVHSLTDFPYALIAYYMARRHDIPFFLNAVGTYSVAPFGRFPDGMLYRRAYRDATRVIAISEYTARAMVCAAGFARPIDVMHLPVMRPVPQGAEDRSILIGLPAGKRFILTIAPARLAGRKGLDILTKAFSHAIRRVPDIHLIVVGSRVSDVAACTSFPELLSAARLAALFSASSLFAAFPRKNYPYFEGYGLVYLEAGLYRLPVIASRTGGVPEAVHDGKTGIIVPENDVSSAASAIVRIMSDPAFAKRLGDENHTLASERNWTAYIRTIISLYLTTSDTRSKC